MVLRRIRKPRRRLLLRWPTLVCGRGRGQALAHISLPPLVPSLSSSSSRTTFPSFVFILSEKPFDIPLNLFQIIYPPFSPLLVPLRQPICSFLKLVHPHISLFLVFVHNPPTFITLQHRCLQRRRQTRPSRDRRLQERVRHLQRMHTPLQQRIEVRILRGRRVRQRCSRSELSGMVQVRPVGIIKLSMSMMCVMMITARKLIRGRR